MDEFFELNPFRLWSLMDLLRVYAQHYISIGETLAYISVLFKSAEDAGEIHNGHPLTNEHREGLLTFLEGLRQDCNKLNLQISSALLSDAIRDLPRGHREMRILSNAIKKEIESKMFLLIPPHRAKYYEWEVINGLFNSFPLATIDLIRASKCFAKYEDIACVFHSMRAAEIALRALAAHLKVTFPFPIDLADWHNLITNIESVIKRAEQQPKSAEKDKELKFCSAAASQFRYFKEAYRKHVSHARETYNEEQALSIMERTAEFLKNLDGNITEL
jgi:HEPN domain-containing protein